MYNHSWEIYFNFNRNFLRSWCHELTQRRGGRYLYIHLRHRLLPLCWWLYAPSNILMCLGKKQLLHSWIGIVCLDNISDSLAVLQRIIQKLLLFQAWAILFILSDTSEVAIIRVVLRTLSYSPLELRNSALPLSLTSSVVLEEYLNFSETWYFIFKIRRVALDDV